MASVIASAALFAQHAHAAGAAYAVDTAEVGDPGNCKVESWVSTASNHDFYAATNPSCVLGLFKPVEVSTQFSRSRASEEWASGAIPKLKMNLIPTAIGSWGLAISGQAAYDLISGAPTSYYITVPATLRVSNVVRVNLNAGWQKDRVAEHNYFTYGAGFDWRTPDNVWTLTGEVFGILGAQQEDNRTATQPRFQLGLRWRPVDEFNIDLIYGRNIMGENANWLTLATVFRFKVGQ